jgi:hypothetical protein
MCGPSLCTQNGIMNAISADQDELKKLLANLTFGSSQSEESDSAAERRWENEGGNPGQLQQLPWDDRKQGTITGPAKSR